MSAFIPELIQFAKERVNLTDTSQLLVILPTKRAVTLFHKQWSLQSEQTEWLPLVITLQDFKERVSGVRASGSNEWFVELYSAYRKFYPEGDSPEGFYATAKTLYSDFEEVRQHGIDPTSIFQKVRILQDLEQWDPNPNTDSPVLGNYLNFWENLATIYQEFYHRLEEKNMNTSSMVMEKLNARLEGGSATDLTAWMGREIAQVVMAGFTALTPLEQKMTEQLESRVEFHFVMDGIPAIPASLGFEANHFIDRNQQQVKGFHLIQGQEKHRDPWSGVQTLHSTDQAKVVGNYLSKLSPDQLDQTVLVLLDSSELPLLLNALPPNVGEVNIGIGRSLAQTLPGRFILTWLQALQADRPQRELYIQCLEEPLFRLWKGTKAQKDGIRWLQNPDNPLDSWRDYVEAQWGPWNWLFASHKSLLSSLRELIAEWLSHTKLKSYEVVFQEIETVLDQTQETLENIPKHWMSSLSVEKFFLREMKSRQITFKGERTKGLQIMSLLETRALDFRRMYVLSFNESAFPAIEHQSFIPLEVRKFYQLPSKTDREAALSYHFFRLLTRAEEVNLFHTADVQALGGEKPPDTCCRLKMSGLL
ncbi:hypothetical protein KFE98_11470 [bacterium SCSIO 12741]|nr:hypothetical protein KFE98_11470 [bacterium SCSIO 12741]